MFRSTCIQVIELTSWNEFKHPYRNRAVYLLPRKKIHGKNDNTSCLYLFSEVLITTIIDSVVIIDSIPSFSLFNEVYYVLDPFLAGK